jgi:hypothetical protein
VSTFLELENSRERSRPADLYRFDYGSEVFRFTSSEDAIEFSGATYEPLQIRRGSPTLNPREQRSQKMQLSAPAAIRPFSDFTAVQPARKLQCNITRIQLDESQLGFGSPEGSPLYPSPANPIRPHVGFVIFEGYITSIAFEGQTCKIDMNPDSEQFNREVPRYKYQSLCNHVLYDAECAVDKNLFKQSGLVNSVSGNQISVGGFTGTSFTGGYVQNLAGTDYRMIIEHSGDVFTLLLPFSENPLGTTLTAFQGCAHDVTTCLNKFNNVDNFGGFPFVPTKNPFEQNAFAKTYKES